MHEFDPSVRDYANSPATAINSVLYLNGGGFGSTLITLQINNSLINVPYCKIVYANGTDEVIISNTLFIVKDFFSYPNKSGGAVFNKCSFNQADLTGIVGDDNIANAPTTSFDQSYRNTDDRLDTAQIGPYHGTYYWGKRGTGPVDPTDPTGPVEPKDKVLLRITMTDSSEREYGLTKQGAADFMAWLADQPKNPSVLFYEFQKDFSETKEYILFDKILSFEVRKVK